MIDGDLYPHTSPIFYGAIDVCCSGESVRIQRNRIFADGKYLVDSHIVTATGKPYDMQ
jgi:hypothetical protein